MKEKPSDKLLDRKKAEEFARSHFADQIELMLDLTNYGSNLVLRAFNSSSKGLCDVVTCGVLLKQIVVMLDAVTVLLQAGTAYAAFLPARAAFEASLYLDWMLFSDTERKAKCYIVSQYRDERRWAARAIHGTPEEAAFTRIAGQLGIDIHARRPTLASEAKVHLADIDRILLKSEFKAIDQEFEAIKKKKKKRKLTYEPNWYEPLGVTSIRTIADTLGRLPEYEIFYSKSSRVTHSASYKDQVRFGKLKAHLIPIRHYRDIDEVINFVVVIALSSFRNILHYYRPAELKAFAKKYMEDWRSPFRTVKAVKYEVEPKDP